MQQPVPTDALRIPADRLERFVADLYRAVPIPADHADLIARLLVDTQMRGVYSHGVHQVERYLDYFENEHLNVHPQLRVTQQSAVTTAIDGDWGLGMIAADEAIRITIAKAREHGVAVTTTRQHGHIGSCGKYVRYALREGLGAFCLTGRCAMLEARYRPDRELWSTTQGAPGAAFGMPSPDGQPDFLLDMACYLHNGRDELLERWPDIVFRMFGLAHLANIMSGTLAGQADGFPDGQCEPYKVSFQSAFYMVIDPDRFGGREAYLDDMDRLLRGTARVKPFEGRDTAALAGGPEHDHEHVCRRDGVPVWGDAQESLQRMAERYHIPAPWPS
ncbi:MAG: hypothetical protein CMJ49_09470 [Planctomycetaceae bacterium]|nr:hypothetical protein [Planctomycetaceae bacterium]